MGARESLRGQASLAEGEGAFLARQRRSFGLLAWLDAQLPARSKTLVLGIHELYAVQHRVRGGGNFDGPRVARYLSATDAATLVARFRGDEFTHVAVCSPGLQMTQEREDGLHAERRTVLSSEGAAVLRGALNDHMSLVAEHEGLSLFAFER